MDERQGKAMRQVAPYLGMGVQLAITVAAFAGLGWWLDSQFGTEPILFLIGIFTGAVGGMISFIRRALRANSGRSRAKPD